MKGNYYSNYYYYIIIILEFFTSVSADGLSLEFEWQQVSWLFLAVLSFG